jgi:hypothetical protein
MERLMSWDQIGQIVGPQGDTGPAGPPGPTAVSADADNQAALGSDGLTFVPPFRNTLRPGMENEVDYTLQASDINKLIMMGVFGAGTLTIPSDLDANEVPVGSAFEFIAAANIVTLTGPAGTSFFEYADSGTNSPASPEFPSGSWVRVVKSIGFNSWLVTKVSSRIPSYLISADANNAIVPGTDELLHVEDVTSQIADLEARVAALEGET